MLSLLSNISKCLDHCATFMCHLLEEGILMKELKKEFLWDMRHNLKVTEYTI